MKTILLLTFVLFSVIALAQKMSPEEYARKRAEFDRRLRERIFNNANADSDRWVQEMESAMEELMQDSLRDIDSLRRESDSFGFGARGGTQLAWSESKDGRTLTVIPANPEVQMDVQVLNGIITIKTEMTKGNSRSQSSSTQMVPGDCDGDLVKTEGKDGKLVLFFPWRKSETERKPLKAGQPKIDI
jgi:hypothetical protein